MNTYKEICEVEVPKGTQSYVPIPNAELIEGIKQQAELADLKIVGENYQLGGKGNQMFGTFVVEPKALSIGNDDVVTGDDHFVGHVRDRLLQRAVGFRNSYDKSLPVGFVAGANVIVCSNMIFEGEILRLRKHTANIYQDLDNLIYDVFISLDKTFVKVYDTVNKLKEVKIDKTLAAELCGRMFIEEDIITSTQLNIIKRELQIKPLKTAWDFMNACTQSLKASTPRTRMEMQLNVNEYIKKELLSDNAGVLHQ